MCTTIGVFHIMYSPLTLIDRAVYTLLDLKMYDSNVFFVSN